MPVAALIIEECKQNRHRSQTSPSASNPPLPLSQRMSCDSCQPPNSSSSGRTRFCTPLPPSATHLSEPVNQPAMPASVVVVKTTGGDGQHYELEETRNWCTLGSHPECDIIIHSRGVANLHALVVDDPESGAKLFGLDDDLPTVFPAKKKSLFKDDEAALVSGDVFIIGERNFRFETDVTPRAAAARAASAKKTAKTASTPSKRQHSPAGRARRASLVVEKDAEKFQEPARTHTFMTTRRLSLGASEVQAQFFRNMVSPRKKKKSGSPSTPRTPATERSRPRHNMAGSPSRERSPLMSKSAVQALRWPAAGLVSRATAGEANDDGGDACTTPSPRQNVFAREQGSAVRPPGRATPQRPLHEQMTPRRAKFQTDAPTYSVGPVSSARRAQTPRRPAVAQNFLDDDDARAMTGAERLHTPRRALSAARATDAFVPGAGARFTADEEMRTMTPRRAATAPRRPAVARRPASSVGGPRRAHSAVKAPREGASPRMPAYRSVTPAVLRRSEGEAPVTPRTKDRQDSARINKRVAAESPLFESLSKRAKTGTKPTRTGLSHRDALAHVTPARGVAQPRRNAGAAPEGVRVGTPKDVAPLDLSDTGVVGSEWEGDDNDIGASVGDKTDTGGASEEPSQPRKSLGSKEEQLALLALLQQSLQEDLPSHEVSQPDRLESESPPVTPKADTQRRSSVTSARRPMPVPSVEAAKSRFMGASLSASRAAGKGKARSRPASLSGVGSASGEEDESEIMWAGMTPAAGMVPRAKPTRAATDSRLGPVRRRSVSPDANRQSTPERQIRHSTKQKECLSQKPRSAISKSARKVSRRPVDVRKSVLFADAVGENIELPSGPHYSPPPKMRSPSARRLPMASSPVAKGSPAARQRNFVAPLTFDEPEDEQAARFVAPLGSPVAIKTAGSSAHRTIGPAPNTPLGMLGSFFYPTRPAVPLLTNGPPKTDTVEEEEEGEEGEEDANEYEKGEGESMRSTDSSSLSDQAFLSIPFTESESAADIGPQRVDSSGTEAATPPRRNSLLGGLASSVLRRLSGASAPEDVSTLPNETTAVPRAATSGPRAASSSFQVNDEEDEGMDYDVFEASEDEDVNADNSEDDSLEYDVFEAEDGSVSDEGEEGEVSESVDNSQSNDEDASELDEADGSLGSQDLGENDASGRGGDDESRETDESDDLEADGDDVSRESGQNAEISAHDTEAAATEETPKRRSLLDRAFSAMFTGSVKKESDDGSASSPESDEAGVDADSDSVGSLKASLESSEDAPELEAAGSIVVNDVMDEDDSVESNDESDSNEDSGSSDDGHDEESGNDSSSDDSVIPVHASHEVDTLSTVEAPQRQSFLGRLSAVFRGSAKKADAADPPVPSDHVEEPAVTTEELKADEGIVASGAVRTSTSGRKHRRQSEQTLSQRAEIPLKAPPATAALNFTLPSPSDEKAQAVVLMNSRNSTSGKNSRRQSEQGLTPRRATPAKSPATLSRRVEEVPVMQSKSRTSMSGRKPSRKSGQALVPKSSPSMRSQPRTPSKSPAPPTAVAFSSPVMKESAVEAEDPAAVVSIPDYSKWTVKELRELVSGLGHPCNGLRKAALVELALFVLHGDATQDAVEEEYAGKETPSDRNEQAVAEENEISEVEAEEKIAGDVEDQNMESSELSFDSLMKHTVNELRKMLKDQGLDTGGRKAELVERLQTCNEEADPASSEDEGGIEEMEKVPEDEPTTEEKKDAESEEPSSVDYSSLLVKTLRALCEEKEISSVGKKSELVARLSDFDLTSEEEAVEEPVPSEPFPDESVSNDSVLDISAMTVAALREELARRDLSTAGKKEFLKSRLEEALAGPSEEVVVEENDSEDCDAEPIEEWKSAEASKMTVAKLRTALLTNAMCGAGNKARLVAKVQALQTGARVTRRNRELLVCSACQDGRSCEAEL